MNGVSAVVVMLMGAGQVPPPSPVVSPETPPAEARPAAASVPSLLVLPPALGAKAPADAVQLAPALERALARALARHGGYAVVSQEEVRKRVAQVSEQQLSGCDESACLAQLAEAMGADWILQSSLTHSPGTWVLRVGLLDRRKASVEKRTEIKARSVDALISSVDTAARQLVGGSGLVAEDPRLAERLGTTTAVRDEFVAELKKQPGADPVTAWTDFVISRNQESTVLPVVQGALVATGAGLMLLLAPAVAISSSLAGVAVNSQGPPYLWSPAERKDTYRYPYIGFTTLVFSAFIFAVPLPFMLGALALGVVDALDLGRIPVAREGCCRDEKRLRAAGRPSALRRVGTLLAAAATAGMLGLPVFTSLFATFASVLATPVYGALVPVLQQQPGFELPLETYGYFYSAVMLLSVTTLIGIYALGLASALITVGLMATEHRSVVDDD